MNKLVVILSVTDKLDFSSISDLRVDLPEVRASIASVNVACYVSYVDERGERFPPPVFPIEVENQYSELFLKL